MLNKWLSRGWKLVLLDIICASIITLAEVQMARANSMSDLAALTEVIYFEARGESELGQIAVGSAVINRRNCHLYPDTIEGVIHQGVQFSYYSDGKPEVYTDLVAHKTAKRIAKDLLSGKIPPIFKATHFYNPATAKKGKWISKLKREAVIGDHVFLIERKCYE